MTVRNYALDEMREFYDVAELVGSRITCNPAPTDTDQDILILTKDHALFRRELHARLSGFVMDGSQLADMACPLNSNDRWSSYSCGELNLIVTQDAEFFDKFMAATSIAKRFNLLDKSDRIAMFQAVLYGNRCD